jgi:starch phosphorylase
VDADLVKVFDAIKSDMFGDKNSFGALVSGIEEHGDYYLVSDDFHSYIATQALIDEAYRDQDEWTSKTILSVSRMGFFSSDRCINEYAESIWNIEPLNPESAGVSGLGKGEL